MALVHISDDEAVDLLGEGIHTSLRKGCEHPLAEDAWRDINNMPAEDWESVLRFLVQGLGSMGFRLAREAPETVESN